jgi:hypothetical protein
MKATQVHLVAAPVFCDSQEIINALDYRFAGEIVRDVVSGNRAKPFGEPHIESDPIATRRHLCASRVVVPDG